MSAPKKTQRTWHYYIDAEGIVWHEGSELDDPDLLRFFMEKMGRGEEGRLQLICQGELCLFDCEDVPYVVQSFEERGEKIRLRFPGGYEEDLDPSSLRVGPGHVLYCRVRQGQFEARFSRKAYLELAKKVEQDDQNRYCLRWAGALYPIQGI